MSESNILQFHSLPYVASPSERKEEGDRAGYGRERYLYELDPSIKCLSPILSEANVLTPLEALYALDVIACSPTRPAFPIDDSLAAFLVSRWKGLGYADMREMRNPDLNKRNLAQLRILSGIQEFYNARSLPALCQWMACLCSAVSATPQYPERRVDDKSELALAIQSGQLRKLVKIFSHIQISPGNMENYRAATTEVFLIQSELKDLQARIEEESLNQLSHMNNRLASSLKSCSAGVYLLYVCAFFKHLRGRIAIKLLKRRMAALHRQQDILQQSLYKMN